MFLFNKMRDVKSPCRGTSLSAGIDLYVPNFSNDFACVVLNSNKTAKVDNDAIIIAPHTVCKIPMGIRVCIPEDIYLKVGNRGSISTKRGLVYASDIIDADYRGELFASVINYTDYSVPVYFGEALVQVIETPVIYDVPTELNDAEILKFYSEKTSERGENCLGSTNKK